MQEPISQDDPRLLDKWFKSVFADNRHVKMTSTATCTTRHAPGPLRIFRLSQETGTYRVLTEVQPGEAFHCGRRISRFILGAPDDLVLCEDCATARGFIW